jgi:hypothetical protein
MSGSVLGQALRKERVTILIRGSVSDFTFFLWDCSVHRSAVECDDGLNSGTRKCTLGI